MTIQVTNNDFVLLGHGSYLGGADNFTLPANVDLYVMQPVGYTLTTDVAEALIQQRAIGKLKLHHDAGRGDADWEPAQIYTGGTAAPNLVLHDLGTLADWGKKTIGTKTNVITVSSDTKLENLLKSNTAIKTASTGKKIKIFWSACASQVSGNRASMT